jgi:tetratricopeptide (TPR) repeat protein
MSRASFLVLIVCIVVVLACAAAQAASVADEVKRLRTDEQDPAAAIALAEQYLTMNPALTLERQRVHYELGATQYAAKDYEAAAATFDRLVADYAVTTLDTSADEFVVDDAQFYIGVIEHYFGDRAKGIAAYEKAIDGFPKSNRRPQALMLLAGVHEQDGDKAKALARFEQLVAEHPKSEQAPEAELHVGHLLRDAGKLDEAIAAFERVAADWPESTHAPTGLMFANRALIAQEIGSVKNDGNRDSFIANEATLRANVELLEAKYGDSDEMAQAMQDLINYYSNWHHFQVDPEFREKIQSAVTWLREHKAGSRQALRAVCEYALCVCAPNDDPQEAIFELDHVIAIARESKDESLLFDVQFNKAHLLKLMGETEQARAVWTGLLEVSPDNHTTDEIRFMLIMLEPIEKRLELYPAFAAEETGFRDLRAMALIFLAIDHRREGRYEQGLEIVETVLRDFADTGSVQAANMLKEQMTALAKAPIEHRGDYVAR